MSKHTTLLLFSKDRAAQADLTISSLKRHHKNYDDCQVIVLWKASNALFYDGYQRAASLHPEVKFIKEESFRHQTLEFHKNCGTPYFAFLVDDDVFIRPFSHNDPEFRAFFQFPEKVLTLSLRMAPYHTICYPACKPQNPPKQWISTNPYSWKHDGCNFDWGYPMSVGSYHLYRTPTLNYMQSFLFKAPNSLEGGLASLWPHWAKEPLMLCYPQARVVTAVNNKVNDENNNRAENTHPVELLNSKFLEGFRLDAVVNDNTMSLSPHTPLKYHFYEPAIQHN